MNEINKIGIRIMGVTALCVLAIFGVWKGITFGMAQYQATQQPKLTELPIPPEVQSVPQATIAPQLEQEISAFAESANENLTGYTKQYVASLPTDIEKHEVLDATKVETFVQANQGNLLPQLSEGTVKSTPSSGKQAIQTYLDAISPVQNPAIKSITGDMITSALTEQESGVNAKALAPIRASIENNFGIFSSVQAPEEALELHTKLLQATLALSHAVELLQSMRTDFVGGLIGQKKLADLNSVFTDISAQILALETKYNIK